MRLGQATEHQSRMAWDYWHRSGNAMPQQSRHCRVIWAVQRRRFYQTTAARRAKNWRSFLDLWSHFAVADYPGFALGEISEVRSFRSVQAHDRLAGAVLSKERDAGGLQYLAHGKQFFRRGHPTPALEFANARFAQVAFCPKPHPGPVQQGSGSHYLLWR
ncbi:hypothetical protein MPLA_140104 [Mesorhizobium sp. ORS 3359]|nr:hypothetical protein MPLA_140104 [Mesorhizobium sp. ORS 3359]